MSNTLIIISTLLAPILAVQVQKVVERIRERRNRKMLVFETLMATRANRLSHDHVRALNMIEFVFGGSQLLKWKRVSSKDKEVIDAWRFYFEALGPEKKKDFEKRQEAFVDMLYAMSQALGFDFDKVQLNNSIYSPQAHGELDQDQVVLRKRLIEILDGKRPILIGEFRTQSNNDQRAPALQANEQSVTSERDGNKSAA